ncbi:zinc finger (C3HC4-type RING finger) family protein [Zea mays]|uniref:Glycosyltransferase family 92 protein n=1 Tax=Zea mays TaxID=4577 RepID=A0A1D6PWT3_MAIZE|nr:zinc finger (C3HC4-type RING finger) family protein [Zea mays]
MNLRPGRLGVASRYQCVFGRDLWKPKQRVLTSPVISAAQEVFRCVTPARVRRHLRMTTDPNGNGNGNDKPMLVSIRTKGQRDSTLPSIAEPEPLPPRHNYRHHRRRPKAHSMCVCTMLRNQARFLREWIIYHSRIGVERWFIYDNNSDDGIEQVLGTMDPSTHNVTRHLWDSLPQLRALGADQNPQARRDDGLHLPARRAGAPQVDREARRAEPVARQRGAPLPPEGRREVRERRAGRHARQPLQVPGLGGVQGQVLRARRDLRRRLAGRGERRVQGQGAGAGD